jgi:transposase-like protein
MKLLEKKKAIKLRGEGKSIKIIARRLGVAKSSVSVWVRNVVLTQKQLQTLTENGQKREVVEKRRHKRIENEENKRKEIMYLAEKEINKISKQELRIIGLCLYWGEGGKTQRSLVRVANSDPVVIKVMMRFFREICKVEEFKFRGHIHTYSHLNARKAEEYWSSVSGIPKNKFFKTYCKPSIASKGKRDKLPFGTYDICICDTKLFLQIMGQIEKLKSLLC